MNLYRFYHFSLKMIFLFIVPGEVVKPARGSCQIAVFTVRCQNEGFSATALLVNQ